MFPFLFVDPTATLLIGLVLLALVNDRPSLEQNQIFVFLRTGKTSWILGQLLYVAVACFLLTAAIYVFPYFAYSRIWSSPWSGGPR